VPEAFQPISPDVCICPECLRELLDPSDRRYRYPFINCTNCGPRFTIIKDIPYDRPLTTMSAFAMCPACAAEYRDPSDRRYHAQPVACPDCGPQIWLEIGEARVAEREEALQTARRLLREGRILAVKGLGGFHLACDATNPQAVAELRARKLRVDKPFAVMFPNFSAVEASCEIDEAERSLLQGLQRPIVILRRRTSSTIAQEVAPGQGTLGVMLPYTPLHTLVLEPAVGFPLALVMTSGNLSEEPIAARNDEARRQLAQVADAFLMHDRDIHIRCDDSVVRIFENDPYPLRRARGYAPLPVRMPSEGPTILACGGELKNVYCIAQGPYAFLSHHIGDLENFETLQAFEEGIAHFERLFRASPKAIAYDLHPNYLATRYTLARSEREGIPAIGVQHHHAHVAACMADHGLRGDTPVIGVSLDGTGYGADGTLWGGEVMVADYGGFRRELHLAYVPLPGGERAVKQPWRMALAWLDHAGIKWSEDLAPVRAAGGMIPGIRRMLGTQTIGGLQTLTSPLTSSMGRLFDAVAALVGVRQTINYEAQAAIELEAVADPEEAEAYPFRITEGEIDASPMIEAVVEDLRLALPPGRIAARFHHGVAAMAVEACGRVRENTGLGRVALSGGVWQNMFLLARTVHDLRREGFEVLTHRRVPSNDGGIALGQAAIARFRLLGQ